MSSSFIEKSIHYQKECQSTLPPLPAARLITMVKIITKLTKVYAKFPPSKKHYNVEKSELLYRQNQ